MIVASRAPLGSQSNAVRDCPLPSPFFLTPASSSQQLHSKQFTRPLFSYSYALICTASSRIPILFNRFRTLCANHPGWGYYLRPALPAYARQRSQPQSLQPFTARFSGYPRGWGIRLPAIAALPRLCHNRRSYQRRDLNQRSTARIFAKP